MISHIVNKTNLETESYYKLGELQKGGPGFKIINLPLKGEFTSSIASGNA